jgi:hypothetical protein
LSALDAEGSFKRLAARDKLLIITVMHATLRLQAFFVDEFGIVVLNLPFRQKRGAKGELKYSKG